jgi:hypothetical protein
MNMRIADAVCAPIVVIVTIFAFMSALSAGCTETPNTINWVFGGQSLVLAMCCLVLIAWRWGRASRGYRNVYVLSGLLAVGALALMVVHVASRLWQ